MEEDAPPMVPPLLLDAADAAAAAGVEPATSLLVLSVDNAVLSKLDMV